MININTLLSFYNPHVAKALALYSLPYVVAFSLASRKSLRIWLAVQQAPVPLIDPEQVASHTRRTWAKVLAVYSLYFLLLGGFNLSNDGKLESLQEPLMIIVVTTLALCTAVAVAKSAADLLQVDKKSVHRNAIGGFVIRRVREPGCGRRVVAKTLILLSAAALTVSSLLHQCHIQAALLSFFISYNFIHVNGGRVSFKIMFLAFTFIVTVYGAIIGFFVYRFGSLTFTGIGTTLVADGQADEPPSLAFWKGLLLSGNKWLLPALLSTLPGNVIALAFRFDYHTHLANQHQQMLNNNNNNNNKEEEEEETTHTGRDEPTFYTVPPPCRSTDLAEGVIIPAASPRRFKKPYYATAFAAWALLNGAVLLLALAAATTTTTTTEVGPPGEKLQQPRLTAVEYIISLWQLVARSGLPEVVAVVNVLGVPLVMSLMMVVAGVRGEMGRLWNYTEHWKVAKGQGVTLA